MSYVLNKEAVINYVKLVRVTRAQEALEPEKQIKLTLGYAIGVTAELAETTRSTHAAFKEATKEAVEIICGVGEIMPLPVKDILDVAYAVFLNRYHAAFSPMSDAAVYGAANMMTGRIGVCDGGNITEIISKTTNVAHGDKGMVVSALNAIDGIIETAPAPAEGA